MLSARRWRSRGDSLLSAHASDGQSSGAPGRLHDCAISSPVSGAGVDSSLGDCWGSSLSVLDQVKVARVSVVPKRQGGGGGSGGSWCCLLRVVARAWQPPLPLQGVGGHTKARPQRPPGLGGRAEVGGRTFRYRRWPLHPRAGKGRGRGTLCVAGISAAIATEAGISAAITNHTSLCLTSLLFLTLLQPLGSIRRLALVEPLVQRGQRGKALAGSSKSTWRHAHSEHFDQQLFLILFSFFVYFMLGILCSLSF